MDVNYLDSLTRRSANSLSRRSAFGLVVTGFAGALGIASADANKHKGKGKNKRNKPQTNAFGCLNVGQKCDGNDNDNMCCSGICQGKKPKKGEKDKLKCVAHNAGTCQANQDSCLSNEIFDVPCGTGGSCFRTTGNASFCGVENQGNCVICAKDKDCEPVFGLGAACIVCGECEDEAGGKKFKTVTRTFGNSGVIAIVDEGAAIPYPSALDVSGFKRVRIKDINIRLRGFSHPLVSDVDTLLVAPGGRNAIVMSDITIGNGASEVTLTLDDQAAVELANGSTLESGAFRPANREGTSSDEFPVPAPQVSGSVQLSTFNGLNPNGQWRLFVFDDIEQFGGSIAGGWELEIKAKVKKRGNGKRA